MKLILVIMVKRNPKRSKRECLESELNLIIENGPLTVYAATKHENKRAYCTHKLQFNSLTEKGFIRIFKSQHARCKSLKNLYGPTKKVIMSYLYNNLETLLNDFDEESFSKIKNCFNRYRAEIPTDIIELYDSMDEIFSLDDSHQIMEYETEVIRLYVLYVKVRNSYTIYDCMFKFPSYHECAIKYNHLYPQDFQMFDNIGTCAIE